MIDKNKLISTLFKSLESDIANSERLLAVTQKLVNDSPGAMQSHSDTSRFQGGVLARNQEASLKEKKDILHGLTKFVSQYGIMPSSKIDIGSVFTINDEEKDDNFFLLPMGGGNQVVFQGKTYCVVTLKSPIVTQLIGRKVGGIARLSSGKIVEITEVL